MTDRGERQEHGERAEYWRSAPSNRVSGAEAVNAALAILMPGAVHRDTAALFDNRVSYHTVRAWRRSARAVPRWAIELLSAKLKAHIDRQYAIADCVARAEIGRGCGWNKTGLNAWRAAGRPQKQKPGV